MDGIALFIDMSSPNYVYAAVKEGRKSIKKFSWRQKGGTFLGPKHR